MSAGQWDFNVKIVRWSAYEALGGAGGGRGIAYFPVCRDKLEKKERRRKKAAPQPTCASCIAESRQQPAPWAI